MNREEAQKIASSMVDKMSIEERANQLVYTAKAVSRLDIKEYNWWNEALHGVARAGTATVFPQAIGMAASFNSELLYEVARAIALEGRAKHNAAVKNNDRGRYKGLTFWSPNINIFRDPRWGRGHETYGEDPFLTSKMGTSFVNGLQGDGKYLKAAACVKHFAAHSGPESIRHGFNSVVDDHDLFDTYLPAFERIIKDTEVEAVMGAYNAINGEPCCASKRLLCDILRDKWGFEGHVVSDCGAIADIHLHHRLTSNAIESSTLSLKNGCDLNCGEAYTFLMAAYDRGLVTEEDITTSAVRLLTTRVMLGEFDESNPYNSIPFSVVDSPEHRELNYKMACESLVLLKNEDSFLPLDKSKIKSIAVIGPNAQSMTALKGNYCGVASEYITVVDGIRSALPEARLYFAQGSHLYFDTSEDSREKDDRISEAIAATREADVTVLCVGLDASIEGEQGDPNNAYASGDKKDLLLPPAQQRLVEKVCSNSENVIIVILSGSCVDVNPQGRSAKAVIQAWYPGAVGGRAIADLIIGKFSPSGKLPVTFYHGTDKLPPFEDYSMKGRTYRYIESEPLYPFGFGLTYSSFEFSDMKAEKGPDSLAVSVNVTNTGKIDASQVVQVYAVFDEGFKTPNFTLCGLCKVNLLVNQTETVNINIPFYWLMPVTPEGQRVLPKNKFRLFVGSHQPDSRSNDLCKDKCLYKDIII
jgi:beta-glucosidase